MMNRDRLERMTLEELRALAFERKIDGAPTLARGALIERLLARPPTAKEARSTTAREARPARGGFDVPSSTVHPHADELETLSMARRYAEEGLLDRALEIFAKLVTLDPDDEALAAEKAALEKRLPRRPPPPAPPPPAHSAEPMGMLDYEELPETYGVDECEVLYKDPHWVFAYWEVTDAGLGAARAQLGPSAGAARLVLRLFSTTSTVGGGVEREIKDVDLPGRNGRRYLPAPRTGAHLRVAVGLISPEGYFAPIAHSSLVRVPPAEAAPPGPVEWMEVVPARSRGQVKEPLVIVRRGQEHSERGPGGEPIAPGGGPTSPGGPLGGSSSTSRGGGSGGR
jgi:hypothetical protein